jgi:toxin ParE1/3/4
MKFEAVALQRADIDIRRITTWIAERSLQGATSWLDAYELLVQPLETDAASCPVAMEDAECSIPLKQALFGTRHGRTYRAVFTIVGDQVRILRVRGPGQPPLSEDELL